MKPEKILVFEEKYPPPAASPGIVGELTKISERA